MCERGRPENVEPPAELAGGLKAVDLDAMFGYAVRPNPRVTEEERWKEDDAEPIVVEPAVIEEPEEIDTYPACRFLLSPSAHKEFAVDS